MLTDLNFFEPSVSEPTPVDPSAPEVEPAPESGDTSSDPAAADTAEAVPPPPEAASEAPAPVGYDFGSLP